jgi:hypothetical protein
VGFTFRLAVTGFALASKTSSPYCPRNLPSTQLRAGGRSWRVAGLNGAANKVAAVVRGCPEEAVRTLTDLGYDVC